MVHAVGVFSRCIHSVDRRRVPRAGFAAAQDDKAIRERFPVEVFECLIGSLSALATLQFGV